MPGQNNQYAIVADIGGTFARFGRANLINNSVDHIETYTCAQFINLEAAIITYQVQHALQYINQMAIAIACPVLDDHINMPNNSWCFSIQELQSKLSLSQLKVINDLSAIAMSLPALEAHELIPIGPKQSIKSEDVKVILGIGTGLGIAYLVPTANGYKARAGEGGHADWGAQTEQEWFIYSYLKQHYDHVSYERLLSGQGLENLYHALAAYHQKPALSLTAAEIITLALQQDHVATITTQQFFSILGTYAGDLALTFGAIGGVYLAGGIIPRLYSLIPHADFRARFEAKGRFSYFNASIPTWMISSKQPGLMGAALSLQPSLAGVSDVIC